MSKVTEALPHSQLVARDTVLPLHLLSLLGWPVLSGQAAGAGEGPLHLDPESLCIKDDGSWRINSSFRRVRRSVAGARAPLHARLHCHCPQWEPADKTPCFGFLPFPDSFPYSLPGISCDLFPNKLLAIMFFFQDLGHPTQRQRPRTAELFNETKPQGRSFSWSASNNSSSKKPLCLTAWEGPSLPSISQPVR